MMLQACMMLYLTSSVVRSNATRRRWLLFDNDGRLVCWDFAQQAFPLMSFRR
jgi:hypothetical protein